MRRAQAGVTLVEMLIALTVFSFIAVSSVVAMRLGLNSHSQFTGITEEIIAFDKSRTLLKSDFLQITDRSARDVLGRKGVAAVKGGAYINGFSLIEEGEELLLSFVRNGPLSPGARYPVSSLQYVELWRVEDRIIRRAWPYIDRLEETPFTEQIMFDKASDVEIRFFHTGQWRDQWRSRPDTLAPRAIEIKFTHDLFGPLYQIFHLPEIG